MLGKDYKVIEEEGFASIYQAPQKGGRGPMAPFAHPNDTAPNFLKTMGATPLTSGQKMLTK